MRCAFHKVPSAELEVPAVIEVSRDGGLDCMEAVPQCFWRLEALPHSALSHLKEARRQQGVRRRPSPLLL